MQVYMSIVLLATVVALAIPSQQIAPPDSPCDYVKCGYGARCQLGEQGNPKCVCPTVCPQYFLAICGSDGKTYGNTCFMNVAACQQKKEILKVSDGECPTGSQTRPPLLPTKISPGIGLPKFKCPAKPKTTTPVPPQEESE